MRKTNWLKGLLVLAGTLALVSCAALRSDYSVPTQHPEELPAGRPMCTECHDPQGEYLTFQDFNHTVSFASGEHRYNAYQNARVCATCHPTSFCNTCHVTRVELKPSIRDQVDTYRTMPHRGDYLTRHRIDARIDPTPCFRCHGNPKSSQTCTPCHG